MQISIHASEFFWADAAKVGTETERSIRLCRASCRAGERASVDGDAKDAR